MFMGQRDAFGKQPPAQHRPDHSDCMLIFFDHDFRPLFDALQHSGNIPNDLSLAEMNDFTIHVVLHLASAYSKSSRLLFSNTFTISPTCWARWRSAIRSASGVSTTMRSLTPRSATSF